MILHPTIANGCVGAWCPSVGYTGYTLRDRSGLKNDGVLTNMDSGTDWVASSHQLALDFDGSTNGVALADSDAFDFGAGDFTFSAWVRHTSASSTRTIVGKDLASNRQFNFYVLANVLGVNYFVGATNVSAVDSASLTLSTWQHVCAQRVGDSFQFWVNGLPRTVGTTTGTHGTMNSTTTLPYIGQRAFVGSESRFIGQLDDILIHKRALAPTEIGYLALRRGIAYEPPRRPTYRKSTSVPQTISLGIATETDSELGVTVLNPQSVSLGIAAEVDSALALSILNPNTITLGIATETDAALGLTIVESEAVQPSWTRTYFSTLPTYTSGLNP